MLYPGHPLDVGYYLCIGAVGVFFCPSQLGFLEVATVSCYLSYFKAHSIYIYTKNITDLPYTYNMPDTF